MKLTLVKSWTNRFGRKYPIGQTMLVDKELGDLLLSRGYAKEFEDSTSKKRTDFFKPKN